MVVYWRGAPTGDDMRAIYALYDTLLPPGSDIYACSIMKESGVPSPDARRVAASAPQASRFRAMVFVGVTFHFRVLIEMVTRAQVALSRGATPNVKFSDELPEALEWLRKQQKLRGATSR